MTIISKLIGSTAPFDRASRFRGAFGYAKLALHSLKFIFIGFSTEFFPWRLNFLEQFEIYLSDFKSIWKQMYHILRKLQFSKS